MTEQATAERLRRENEQVVQKLGKRLRARQVVFRGEVVSNPRRENGRADEDSTAFNISVYGDVYSVLIWSKKSAKENWALKALSDVKRGDFINAKGFLSIYTLPRQKTPIVRVKARRFRIVTDSEVCFANATLRGEFFDAQRVGGSVVEVRLDAGRETTAAAERKERLDRFMVEGAAAERVVRQMTAGDPIEAKGDLYISRLSNGQTEYAFAEIPCTQKVVSGIGLI